jgi:hypothetical protein
MYQGLLLMLQKIRKFSGLKLAQPVHSILLSRPSLWTLWWAYLERVMGLSVRGLFHIIPSLLKWIQPRIKTCVKQSKISNIKGMIHCTPYSLLPNDRQRDVVCRKDTPRGVFSIRYVWNSIHPVQNNVEWWHLFGTNRRSCDSSSSYGLLFVKHYWLEIGLCHLVSFRFHGLYYVGMIVRILTTLFFYCTFSRRIWYDLCSICFIPFRSQLWNNTISWLSNLGSDYSLTSVIIILMLVAITIYYI